MQSHNSCTVGRTAYTALKPGQPQTLNPSSAPKAVDARGDRDRIFRSS